ncbi:MAG: TetR/AcrR family transcriptional regulator [Actinomycetes bacterium]
MNVAVRPYRLGERAVRMEQTVERILQAAVEEFWSAPDPDIRLESVAERAGVSVQTVLRHFDSKAGLMTRAAQWQALRVRQSRDPSMVNDAASAARQLVDHYEEVGDAVLRMLGEVARVPGLAPIAEEGRAFHREWCERAFAASLRGLGPAERRIRLAQLLTVCDVYTWMLLRRQSGLSRAATQTAIAELITPLLTVA